MMNRRSAIGIALLAFVPVSLCIAAEKTRAEKPAEALLRVDYFSVWGVGYAGTPTANEKTFRAFMEQKPSTEDALRLINDGTPAGRIYGFLALKNLSPDQFAKRAPEFFGDSSKVKTLSGCDPTPLPQTTGKLVKEISEGKIILSKRRE
jgi:hypothetical protein